MEPIDQSEAADRPAKEGLKLLAMVGVVIAVVLLVRWGGDSESDDDDDQQALPE